MKSTRKTKTAFNSLELKKFGQGVFYSVPPTQTPSDDCTTEAEKLRVWLGD